MLEKIFWLMKIFKKNILAHETIERLKKKSTCMMNNYYRNKPQFSHFFTWLILFRYKLFH